MLSGLLERREVEGRGGKDCQAGGGAGLRRGGEGRDGETLEGEEGADDES